MPTLFTLRDDESRIIAVMSSNVDDLLYGYFVGKSFDKTKTLAFMPQLKTTLSEYNQSLRT